MSSLTIPKFVEIASTISFRRRVAGPVPVENKNTLGSVANLSMMADEIVFPRRSSRAFSTTSTPQSAL
jgi:hypothetical protein